jgi:molybdopterin converting factor small subunit
MELTVYGPLRSATGEKTVSLSVEGETVADLLDAFVATYPRTESQLFDDSGTPRPSVRVTVDGETAALEDPLPPDAAVALFPAMRGG